MADVGTLMQQKTHPGNIRNRKIVDLHSAKVACKECSLHQLCLPRSINGSDLEKLDNIIERKKPLKRHDHLFQVGSSFNSIYVVR